ncbi:MAG: hypothetical protein K2M20_01955 [Lachnospiraceae bacterium]|nr:hypothetical protein [Lachnospiraceae bacterium]
MLTLVLAMGMAACSSDRKEETAAVDTIAEPEVIATEVSREEDMEDTKEYAAPEETVEADPITGIVESYADNTIIIKDPGDEILYYFSTKDAQIVEGDPPIAVGDKVEITYRGMLGDEKNPGEAVKIVADIVK